MVSTIRPCGWAALVPPFLAPGSARIRRRCQIQPRTVTRLPEGSEFLAQTQRFSGTFTLPVVRLPAASTTVTDPFQTALRRFLSVAATFFASFFESLTVSLAALFASSIVTGLALALPDTATTRQGSLHSADSLNDPRLSFCARPARSVRRGGVLSGAGSTGGGGVVGGVVVPPPSPVVGGGSVVPPFGS